MHKVLNSDHCACRKTNVLETLFKSEETQSFFQFLDDILVDDYNNQSHPFEESYLKQDLHNRSFLAGQIPNSLVQSHSQIIQLQAEERVQVQQHDFDASTFHAVQFQNAHDDRNLNQSNIQNQHFDNSCQSDSLLMNPNPPLKLISAPVLAPRKKRHRADDRLSLAEKKANHIASEQKRRQNIRLGLEAIALLVPTLYHQEMHAAESSVHSRNYNQQSITNHAKSMVGIPAKSVILHKGIFQLL